jgi:16S rRNA (guanine966-N2)-methyltransferase
MRIVGGKYKRRIIAAPDGPDTRPTADRVREALFNILEHGVGFDIEGAVALDLFAGSGGLGIEALSRGAGQAIFVDNAPTALAVVRANLASLGEEENGVVLRRDATRLGALPPGVAPATLAFCDPPYNRGLVVPALAAAFANGWLTPDAVCVVEASSDEEIDWPESFQVLGARAYGKTKVTVLQSAA